MQRTMVCKGDFSRPRKSIRPWAVTGMYNHMLAR